MAFDNASDLRNAALGREISLAKLAEWEKRVRNDFWSKIRRLAGKLPFVEDIVAAYYCALDPATPLRVRGMLLAAIAYFILPFDFVPDIIAGLGFADDAALVTAVVALVSAHITPNSPRRRRPRSRQRAAENHLTSSWLGLVPDIHR